MGEHISFRRNEGLITVKPYWKGNPVVKGRFVNRLTDIGGKMGFLLNTIKESGGIDVFHILVERTVQPVCTGRLIDPNAEVEKEKGTEMQETQDAVQDTLQNTAQDAVQDTPQKAVHKFVGDAAQKIVQ